jgi:hypothetical protein
MMKENFSVVTTIPCGLGYLVRETEQNPQGLSSPDLLRSPPPALLPAESTVWWCCHSVSPSIAATMSHCGRQRTAPAAARKTVAAAARQRAAAVVARQNAAAARLHLQQLKLHR